MFNFEKLEVWKLSKELCKVIFNFTKDFPNNEKYVLIDQMRRASLSVPSNIAEGSSRMTVKDKQHFYTMAYSSLMELVNHSIISNELNYIDDEQLNFIKSESLIIAKMISKLRKNTF
ncbi:four helix bundle protein [Weeksellaceae bacterium KMM 9724]|uniref:four helix bundle protein n=1 Tax=Profundicola chukchiensis TaxID=2961959 RepID=UPI00243BD4AA|nr:four helix bundle protein [Profundicola chukchiensis]MDG4950466.1 four helix bundle protein [Profundicola chukchiensis]